MERSGSFNYGPKSEKESQNHPWNGDFGLGAGDRRLAFSRQASFQQPREPHAPTSAGPSESARPFLSRSASSIDIPPEPYSEEENVKSFGVRHASSDKLSVWSFVASAFRILRSGNRYMKRLFALISLNVAYSTAELCIGLLSGRVGMEKILLLSLIKFLFLVCVFLCFHRALFFAFLSWACFYRSGV